MDSTGLDSLELVLRAVAQANTILRDGVIPLAENPAIQSLRALGAPIVRVADAGQAVVGRTLVLDAATLRYVPDEGRPGGPSDGTRFILYAVDTTSRAARVPLSEVGYLDVAGLSGSAVASRTVHAVIAGTTAFSYRASGVLSDPSTGFVNCCNHGVLAGPRQISAAGTLMGSAGPVAFTYADSIVVSSIIDDGRNYDALPTSGGNVKVKAVMFYHPDESDSEVSIWIAFPGGPRGRNDSTVVGVRADRFGNLQVGVSGSGAVSYGACRPSPNVAVPCFRFRGDSILSDTLVEFVGLVRQVRRSLNLSVFGDGAWLASAEAFVAPVIFAARWAVNAGGTGLVVHTTTSGAMLDPDGYSVNVDDTVDTSIGLNDYATLPSPGLGSHQVELTGVAANCVVLGWNPRLIKLAYGQDTLSLDVECSGTPVRRGRLAFERGHDIYAVNADGSGLANLSNDPAWEDGPAWSPDGTRLAFRSFRNGYEEIWVAKADGSGPVNVTNNVQRPDRESEIFSDVAIAWSPDGNRIAYPRHHHAVECCSSQVAVVDVASGSTVFETLGDAFDWDPQWSPDGAQIAFTRTTYAAGGVTSFVYLVASDGTALARLIPNDTESENHPRWSPDGTRLAYLSNDDLYVVNVDGSGQVNLTHSPAYDSDFAWSPDGTQIVFASRDAVTYTTSILSADPASGAITPFAADDYLYLNSNLVWSRDGQELAFSGGHGTCGSSCLYVMDRLNRWAAQLTHGAEYDVSPTWQPVAPSLVRTAVGVRHNKAQRP